MKKLIPVLAFALVACGGSPEHQIPPTGDDFVDAKDGTGTAKVFGIDFQMELQGGGVTTDEAIAADFLDPGKSSARKKFALGEDIVIELESMDASTVTFTFNDQAFGTLNVGDKVVIDAGRNVQVNGSPRPPATAP